MDFRAIFWAVLFSATQCGSPVFSQDIIAEQDGLGLGIDEMITDQGKVKVELGASYSAISQDEMEGYFYTIQTGSGEFIDVPIALGTSQREADTMIVRIGGAMAFLKRQNSIREPLFYMRIIASLMVSRGIFQLRHIVIFRA